MDWKRKLTSRKFWVALIGFVTTLLIAFGVDGLTVEQVTGVITAGGVLIAYILGESYADGKHNDVLQGIEVETEIEVEDDKK
jgi:hypothetical protein